MLKTVPDYKVAESEAWIEAGASRISVVSRDHEAYAGLDTERIAMHQLAMGKAMVKLREATQANRVSWTVVACR